MHLSIQREALLEPLQLVVGVVERRQTKRILANVLLTVEDQELSLTATDLEIELAANAKFTHTADASQAQALTHPQPKPTTVSGRKLLDICRVLPAQAQIELQEDGAGRLLIRAGCSRFVLATLPAEEFPRFEESEELLEFAIGQKEFNNLLLRTHFAMAQQDVRHYLNGMLLEIKQGKLIAVTTDGHRFAMNHQAVTVDPAVAAQVVVSRKGVLELMRLLGGNKASELTVILGQNHLRVSSKDFVFTSRLIDSRFPDYERIFPRETGKTVLMNRELLRESLLRMAILSSDKCRVVSFQLSEDSLRIASRNLEQEEAEETVAVDYKQELVEIAFNVNYLLDVLNIVTDAEVKLTFTDAINRMFVTEVSSSNDHLFLIMPLQL